MGSNGTGILGALITAVAVFAAAYTGGASLTAAAAYGAAAGAASFVATSMLSQIGLQATTDSATTLSRTTSPTSGMPILYGGDKPNLNNGCYIKGGSTVNWFNVLNGASQFLFTSHAIAMGEITNIISQIYFDDEPVLGSPITTEGLVDNSKILVKYQDILQLEVYFGKESYTAPKILAGQYAGDQWDNSTFHGNGIVQIYTVIKKTQESLENSLLVNDNYVLTCEAKGRIITDLVDMVERCASNGPSQIYDLVTNTDYGMGLDPNIINLDSFRSAAQYCEAFEYYSNGAIDYSQTYKSNIELILQTFGGVLYISTGKLCLAVDVQATSVASFDESNMYGDFTTTTTGMSDYVNTIDATWKNVTNSYSDDVLRIPSDITDDEVIKTYGRIITTTRDYTWTYNKDSVAALVNIELLKSKYSQNQIQFSTYDGWDIQIWDVITVSFAETGLSNKLYRVLGKEVITTQDNIGLVNITAVEYFDAIYQGIDPGIWSADGSISTVANVQPPSNLQVIKKGGTVANGNVVLMTWDASIDGNLRGYYAYYRLSGATTWTYAGSVNQYVQQYEIYSLDPSQNYDFAVAAYNNLGLVSTKLTVAGIQPDYEFVLPGITGLHLVNNDYSNTQTESTDFIFGWDSQSALQVNGKPFSDYFSRYEVIVYNSNGVAQRSYYTQDNNFTYTLAMNKSDNIGRNVKIGVVAWGATSGTYSPEVQLTVNNPQAPLIQNVQALSAIGQIAFTWDADNFPVDFAGVVIQISSTQDFSIGVQTFTTTKMFNEWVSISDGQYYYRLALYDLFGMDGVKYSTITGFNQATDIPFSQLNNDVVDGILASSEFNTVKQEIIDEAGYNGWQISVDNNGYVSGIALGNNGTESVFTIIADRFSLISSTDAGDSTKVYPFVVDGTTGKTFLNAAVIQAASIGSAAIANAAIKAVHIDTAAINTAAIQNGAITTAKIGTAQIGRGQITSTLSSDNYVANNTGIQLDFANGLFYMNGTVSGQGRLVLSNNRIVYYNAAGQVVAVMGASI